MMFSRFFKTACLVGFFLNALNFNAAYGCVLPSEGLVYEAYDVARKNITLNLNQIWGEEDIRAIKSEAMECRQIVVNEIASHEQQIQALLRDKSTIEKMKYINEISSQLKQLEDERDNILKSFMNESNDITYWGIYAVLVYGPLKQAGRLFEFSNSMLAPAAEKGMRDLAYTHTLETDGESGTLSKILTNDFGRMEIERVIVQKKVFFNKQAQLVYLVLVKVKPFLQKSESNAIASGNFQGFVADVLSDDGFDEFQKQLSEQTNRDFAKDAVKEMKNVMIDVRAVVIKNNKIAENETLNISARLSDRMRKKEKIITDLNAELEGARDNLSQIYRDISLACSGEPESCIEDAFRKINFLIEKETDKSLTVKAGDLAVWDEKVIASKDLAKDLSQLAYTGYAMLKESHAGRIKLMNLGEPGIEPGLKDAEERELFVIMEPDKVFIYPYTTSRGEMRLLELMTFQLRETDVSEQEASVLELKKNMVSGKPSKTGGEKKQAAIKTQTLVEDRTKDTMKPQAAVTGILDKYQKGSRVYLKIIASDDLALKSVGFSVENTQISKTWTVEGTSVNLEFSFPSGNLEPAEYAYSMIVQDEAGNSTNMNRVGTFEVYVTQKDAIRDKLKNALMKKEEEKKKPEKSVPAEQEKKKADDGTNMKSKIKNILGE